MLWMVVGASVFIVVSLALAWVATAARVLGIKGVIRLFPAHENIVHAHIDYLLMAILLYVFYMLQVEYPIWMVAAMLFGGTVNPFTFVLVAMSPPGEFKPGPVFSAVAFTSFVATTVGFGGAAVMVLIS